MKIIIVRANVHSFKIQEFPPKDGRPASKKHQLFILDGDGSPYPLTFTSDPTKVDLSVVPLGEQSLVIDCIPNAYARRDGGAAIDYRVQSIAPYKVETPVTTPTK